MNTLLRAFGLKLPIFGTVCAFLVLGLAVPVPAFAKFWFSACAANLTLRKTAYKISPMSFDKASLKNEQGDVSSIAVYRRQMTQLRNKSLAAGFDFNRVSRVLYPFAGTDAGLPIILFPNAKEIALVDDHSFATLEQFRDRSIPVISPIGGAYRYYGDIDRDESNGPRILGDILSLTSNAKIISLSLTDETTDKRSPHISAVVEFDLRDGVGPRTLYYRSGGLPGEIDRSEIKVDDIKRFNPEALIVKAAEGKFRNQYFRKVREIIETSLQSNSGFVVEGLRTSTFDNDDSPEFTGYSFNIVEGDNRRKVINGMPFGYKSDGALVTQYKDKE